MAIIEIEEGEIERYYGDNIEVELRSIVWKGEGMNIDYAVKVNGNFEYRTDDYIHIDDYIDLNNRYEDLLEDYEELEGKLKIIEKKFELSVKYDELEQVLEEKYELEERLRVSERKFEQLRTMSRWKFW